MITLSDPKLRAGTALVAGLAICFALVLGGALTFGAGAARATSTTRLHVETPGGVAHTWSNYRTAGGRAGRSLPARQGVAIACRVRGYRVTDGNVWWYRIAASPWDGRYYVSADAFYNNGRTSGSLLGTPFYDPKVPVC